MTTTTEANAERVASKAPLIYLASPYSHDDVSIRDGRFHAVCHAAARYMAEGHLIFSPIAHTHPIAMQGKLPTNWDFWRKYDHAMLDAADELWVLRLDGWDRSKGVRAEIEYMESQGKPVKYLDPTPEDLKASTPDASREVERLEGELAEARRNFNRIVIANKCRACGCGSITLCDGEPLTWNCDGCKLRWSVDQRGELTSLRAENARLIALAAGMGQGERDARGEEEKLPMVGGRRCHVGGPLANGWWIGVRDGDAKACLYLWHDGEWHTHATEYAGKLTGYWPTREAAVAFIHELAAKEQAAKQSAPVHQRDDHNEALCPVCTPPQPEPFPATTVRCFRLGEHILTLADGKCAAFCIDQRIAFDRCNWFERDLVKHCPEIPPSTAYAELLTTWPEGAARLLELCEEHRVEEKTVMQMLVERKPSPFHPAPRYYSEGDFLTYFLSPAKSLGTHISESLVLYHDQESGQLTGFRLNGVAELLSQAANTSQCKQSAPLPTIGPQRAAPATVAQIQAQTKQAERMALCPACGNKRCPKATNHGYACTGSNEPGQIGTVEQPAPPQPAVESEAKVFCQRPVVGYCGCGHCTEVRREAGEAAIWDRLQEIAPWEQSNDMEWADEILCGIALARDRIRELESQLAAALQTGDMLLEAAAQRQAKANQLESQLAAQSPQWITYTGQELEPGVWVAEKNGPFSMASAFVLPTGFRGVPLIHGKHYCRIGPVPTREGEVRA